MDLEKLALLMENDELPNQMLGPNLIDKCGKKTGERMDIYNGRNGTYRMTVEIQRADFEREYGEVLTNKEWDLLVDEVLGEDSPFVLGMENSLYVDYLKDLPKTADVNFTNSPTLEGYLDDDKLTITMYYNIGWKIK